MVSYIRFLQGERPVFAVAEGEMVYPLRGETPGSFERTGERLPLKGLTLLPPCRPGKIVGVGLNYSDIALKAGEELPCRPKLFLKSPQAVLCGGGPIRRPAGVKELSCEVELAVVIGQTGRELSPEDARQAIWGYLAANDVTASDLQREDVLWGRAKNFDTFLPISSRIVAGIDPSHLVLRCIVNQKEKLVGNSSAMIQNVPQLISYISHIMTLLPGDLILTGTPTGYGVPILPGDVIRVSIDGVGYTENPVQ